MTAAVFAAVTAPGAASRSIIRRSMPNDNVIVAVDLSIGHLSPLRFAAWWAKAHDGMDLIAVHVMPVSAIDQLARLDAHFGDARVRESMAQAAEAVRVEPKLNVVVRAHSVEAGILEACEHYPGDLLVMGRRAVGMGPSWLRLGPVSRDMVRRLPRPVLIVPREWKPPHGVGPVLVMAATDKASAVALAIADRYAQRLEVPLVVGHAIDDPERELSPYFPPNAITELRIERRGRDGAEFGRWFAEQRLRTRTSPVVELGSAREVAAELVARERPCIAIVGSRRLAIRDRWFGGSTSTDLAAHLDAPVLVVPHDYAAG